jgi:hypothetical protein
VVVVSEDPRRTSELKAGVGYCLLRPRGRGLGKCHDSGLMHKITLNLSIILVKLQSAVQQAGFRWSRWNGTFQAPKIHRARP